MKLIRIIGHPVLLMIIYLLLIIEGQNFGGFYLLYLLLALPHAAAYALTALAGLISVFVGYKIYWRRVYPIKPLLYLIGLCLMLLSLVLFFTKGEKGATFELVIPLLTFILFGICCLCFLINTFFLFHANNDGKEHIVRTIS